jgi:diguanylate cyclase (GGDEF)-like protein/PAS domain S-box-containing protein
MVKYSFSAKGESVADLQPDFLASVLEGPHQGERAVFDHLGRNSPLHVTLPAIARWISGELGECTCTIELPGDAGETNDQPPQHAEGSATEMPLGVQSLPIHSVSGQELGRLVVRHASARDFSRQQQALLQHAARLAALAVERRVVERQVLDEKERAQVTLQSIGEAVIRTDAAGLIDYMNPIAETLTGWTLFESRGLPISSVLSLVDEGTRAEIPSPLLRCLRDGGVAGAGEHAVLQSRSRQDVAIHSSVAPIRNRRGETIGAVTVFRDVTKERRLKRALSYQAAHDALTGLINRREFDARLQTVVELARRDGGEHALLYVDLDQFKVVNDTCGHPAGDRLLRDVTALLQTRVRGTDTIARLGGDEFGILLENCGNDQARKLAEGIRIAIREFRFTWNDNSLSIGASIGMVCISAATESVASVMSAADIACYAAKDAGRNRVHLYDQSEVSGRHREMYWVARVTRALEEGRLYLQAQPIVALHDPSSTRPRAFHELLVRMRDEQGHLVMPGEFIPAAERYNVMPAIDRWVVERAAQLLRALPPERAGQLFAVNISGTSLNDPSFIEFTLATLEDYRIASGLCFEITETAAVANLHQAVYFMSELRARGCRFALDDFGSGLSSFRYLKTLPVDYLKIDGQFVRSVATDPVDRSMVEAICHMSRTLGILTIAERVETADVLASLEALGVNYVQGYHLGRPENLSDEADPAPGGDDARPQQQ